MYTVVQHGYTWYVMRNDGTIMLITHSKAIAIGYCKNLDNNE